MTSAFMSVTLLPKGKAELRLEPPEYPFLEGVTVELEGTKAGNAMITTTLSISAPYHEGIELVDAGAFAVGTGVLVEIGWADGNDFLGNETRRVFSNKIDNPSGLTLSPEGVSGSVVAQIAFGLKEYALEKEELSGVSTVLGLLERIIERELLDISGIDTDLAAGRENSVIEIEEVVGMSSVEAVKHVANKYSFDISIEPVDGQNELRLVNRINSKSDIKAHFQMFGVFDIKDGVPLVPIVSFEPELNEVSFERKDLSNQAVIEVGKDGEIKSASTTPQEVDSDEGTEVVTDADLESLGDAVSLTGDTGGPEGAQTPKEKSKRAASNASNNAQFKANLTTVGLPWIRLGDVVRVSGCGQTYGDGNYETKKITHTISGGVFETALEMSKKSNK